jgi:hypothetical protein
VRFETEGSRLPLERHLRKTLPPRGSSTSIRDDGTNDAENDKRDKHDHRQHVLLRIGLLKDIETRWRLENGKVHGCFCS